MLKRRFGDLELTMRCNTLSVISTRGLARAERARNAFLQKRRIYNRLYMRSWRADPRNRACEREHRAQWHYARKLRDFDSHASDLGDPVCGFCHKNPPVTKVWRLEIRDLAPRGYVEVRVPYCGEC